MAVSPDLVKKHFRIITIVGFIVSGLITASWASRIPEMQGLYQLSNTSWGTVLFSVYAGLVCGLPLSSWLINRYGAHRMAFVSGIVFPLTLASLPLATGVPMLVVLLFLFGVVRNLMNLSINTKSVELQRLFRKSIVSSFHGIWSLACLVAAAIGTLMIAQEIPPSYHFLLIALVSVIAIVAFRNRATIRKREVPRSIFAKPDIFLLLIGAMSFCTMMCEGAVYDWSVNYFDKTVAGGKQFVTAGYIAYLLTMTTGRLAGDSLISRFGRKNILIVNGLLMTVGFLLASLNAAFLPAILAFVLVGLGNSIIMPILYFLAGNSTRSSTSAAIATVTLIGYAGLLLQPLIMGVITDTFSMNAAFGIMGTLGIVIVIMVLILARKKARFEY